MSQRDFILLDICRSVMRPAADKYVVAGATGLIGRELTRRWLADGADVVAVSRNPDAARRVLGGRVTVVDWGTPEDDCLAAAMVGAGAVVNLAGENIVEGRWTDERKQALRDSRVNATRRIADALATLQQPPALVNASAIGFYDLDATESQDEESPAGTGFLADMCRAWETGADRAAASTRVVKVRIGVVLTPEGGALKKMLPAFRFGGGGPLGTGKQGFPWVHIHDVVEIIRWVAAEKTVAGIVNAVAPESCDQKTFARCLGRVLRRPAFIPAPAFALKLALGEMADTLLLRGPFVAPKRTIDLGYRFRFPELEPALRDLLIAP